MDIKNTIASLRGRFGSKIYYKDQEYFASVLEIDNADPDFMASDNNGNALNTEQRRFTVNPDNFNKRPKPGEKIVWDGDYYIILDCRILEFQSSPVSLKIIAYKSSTQFNVQDINQLDKWKRTAS